MRPGVHRLVEMAAELGMDLPDAPDRVAYARGDCRAGALGG